MMVYPEWEGLPVEMGLNQLKLGEMAKVTGVEGVLKNRLRDFGLVPGTRVCCRYRTPGGSVTAVEFRGTTVALRTRDLQSVRVQPE